MIKEKEKISMVDQLKLQLLDFTKKKDYEGNDYRDEDDQIKIKKKETKEEDRKHQMVNLLPQKGDVAKTIQERILVKREALGHKR